MIHRPISGSFLINIIFSSSDDVNFASSGVMRKTLQPMKIMSLHELVIRSFFMNYRHRNRVIWLKGREIPCFLTTTTTTREVKWLLLHPVVNHIQNHIMSEQRLEFLRSKSRSEVILEPDYNSFQNYISRTIRVWKKDFKFLIMREIEWSEGRWLFAVRGFIALLPDLMINPSQRPACLKERLSNRLLPDSSRTVF